MHHFDEIYEISAARHGGPEQLESKLSKPKSIAELEALPDDRWLSIITKTIFQAGFSWKVIEAKWDGFETAFDGFDIGRCAFMDDENSTPCFRIPELYETEPKSRPCATMPLFF